MTTWRFAGIFSLILVFCQFSWSAENQNSRPGLDNEKAVRISQSVIGKQVNDFAFLDRQGQPVRLSKFRGKPLFVSFIYTGCFQVCPLTTHSLQNTLQSMPNQIGNDKFNVISIGFNQPADSFQALKSFALQHRIDQPNWNFLQPHADAVDALTREFGFSHVATPAGFDHVLQVTLLDSNGKIYRQIYGDIFKAQALAEPLEQLLRNAPVDQSLSLSELVEKIRILCSVYDPVTGEYRVQYGLILEIAGGLTFFITMFWFFLTELRTRRVVRRASAQKPSSPMETQY